MKEKLTSRLSDPFEIEELGPFGYQFIMASDRGPHAKYLIDVEKAFKEAGERFRDESFSDFKCPPVLRVPLSQNEIEFEDSLTAALFTRKSERNFKKRDTSFDSLSFLLRLAAGVKTPNDKFRTATRFYPSGGNLHTLRIYVDVRNVTGLEPGIYLFNPLAESLDLINDQMTMLDRLELHNRTETADKFENTNFNILISSKPQVALRKYGEHAWRIILMEIGHLAQNLWLVGRGCGYSMFPSSSMNINLTGKFLRTHPQGEFLLYSLFTGYAD